MVLLLLNSGAPNDTTNTQFTFQYGATSTNLVFIEYSSYIVFTFQYGATSTLTSATDIVNPTKFTFQYGATSTR